MVHDPLAPSEALRTRLGTALAVVGIITLIYSVLILGQILLGVIVGFGLTVGLYVTYRSFAVLDSIADAAQRYAAVREREADEASRFGSATERESSSERTRSRMTDREVMSDREE